MKGILERLITQKKNVKVNKLKIQKLPYYLIDVKYIREDITEKNKKLRVTTNPEEKAQLKADIEKCYEEIKKVVLKVEQEQERLLEEEVDIQEDVEEQNLSEKQLSHQIRKLKDEQRIVKAFQKLVNTPTVLKNIRSRT